MARYNHPPRFGVDVLADLKRRLHVQPADWINHILLRCFVRYTPAATVRVAASPSQIDRSTSAESKEAQS